jgi:hypothetical protein
MIEVGVREFEVALENGPMYPAKSLCPPHLVPAGSGVQPLVSSPGLKSGA